MAPIDVLKRCSEERVVGGIWGTHVFWVPLLTLPSRSLPEPWHDFMA